MTMAAEFLESPVGSGPFGIFEPCIVNGADFHLHDTALDSLTSLSTTGCFKVQPREVRRSH